MGNPPGRPTKYREHYCDYAEAILSDDRPLCEVARQLCVNEETITDWVKKHKKFSAAFKRGRAAGKAAFMAKARAAAWDADTHHVNNGLINLLAMNQYNMITANNHNKDKLDVKGTLSLADAVRKRHERNSGS